MKWPDPKFDLERVRACAEVGEVYLTQGRCLDHLVPLLGTYEQVRRFAADVALALRADDFIRTVRTARGQEFDEYGLELGTALADAYAFQGVRVWYLKLRMDEGPYGDFVTYISLHTPEHPMDRRGGRLVPDR